MTIQQHLRKEWLHSFRKLKQMGDRTLAQLTAEQCHERWTPDSNSVAVLVKHLNGNMRSRWTDFLTTDGEKASRQRDDEFVAGEESKEEILAWWEAGWMVVLNSLEGLEDEHVMAEVTIRGEAHTVVQAVLRQHSHYSYHVGQLVQIAKALKGEEWQSLSIPVGQSQQYSNSPGEFGYNAEAK